MHVLSPLAWFSSIDPCRTMDRARGRVLTWLGGGIDPTGPDEPRCAACIG